MTDIGIIQLEKINKMSETKNYRPIVSFVDEPSLVVLYTKMHRCVNFNHFVFHSYTERKERKRRIDAHEE